MKNLEFEDDFSMNISIAEQEDALILYLSDDLEVVEDLSNLPVAYEKAIIRIVDGSNLWFDKSVNKVKEAFDEKCDVSLITVYILSEPSDEPLIFGLGFWVSLDIEHGRGMKIRADTLEVIEYGLADVAFC